MPAAPKHLTAINFADARFYVAFSYKVDEPILVGSNQGNDFNINLTSINSIALKTPAVKDNQNKTKSYVFQFR